MVGALWPLATSMMESSLSSFGAPSPVRFSLGKRGDHAGYDRSRGEGGGGHQQGAEHIIPRAEMGSGGGGGFL